MYIFTIIQYSHVCAKVNVGVNQQNIGYIWIWNMCLDILVTVSL